MIFPAAYAALLIAHTLDLSRNRGALDRVWYFAECSFRCSLLGGIWCAQRTAAACSSRPPHSARRSIEEPLVGSRRRRAGDGSSGTGGKGGCSGGVEKGAEAFSHLGVWKTNMEECALIAAAACDVQSARHNIEGNRAILSSGHGRHSSAASRIARSSDHGEERQWQYQMRGSSGVATRRRASSQAYDSRRGRGNLVEGELFAWLERAFSFLFCLIDYSP